MAGKVSVCGVPLTLECYQQVDAWLAKCPELALCAVGKTEAEARAGLDGRIESLLHRAGFQARPLVVDARP